MFFNGVWFQFINWVDFISIGIPIVEISVGLGILLFVDKRRWVFAAIAMHLLVIVFLVFDTQANQNYIVIPWNVTFIVLLGNNFF